MLILPKTWAAVPFGTNKSPNEKRPLGGFRQGRCCGPLPTPVPLGLFPVEPRGFPTLLRRQKAQGRN